jgi:dipeptidyl aminopeptidase/acylaminoacyl peptidase
MKKVNFQSRNGQNITISAVINFPEGFDEGKKFLAVVVVHPGVASRSRRRGSMRGSWRRTGSSPLLSTRPTRARAPANRASWKTPTSGRKT